MLGEKDLDRLVASMRPELFPERYVFVSTQDIEVLGRADAKMVFKESEGTTFILLETEAERLNLDSHFPCRMITLNIHSSLEAVGFIARIATHLSRHAIGVNPVAGFYHDHLFITEDRASDAMEALTELVNSASNKSKG